MSDSEDESFEDFSASEDEYVPTAEDDSDSDEKDDDQDDDSEVENNTTKRPKGRNRKKAPAIATSKFAKRSQIANDDDDSDSSVENYLVNPNEIDLKSDFFNSKPNTTLNIPTFDCNIGVSLSDSEEEVFEDVSSTSQTAISKPLDFVAHENFNKELEIAKNQLRTFKSSNFGQDTSESDVTKLLAIGEASLAELSSSKKLRKKDLNASDESDWEEVADDVKTQQRDNVEIHIGPTAKKKVDKYQAEIEASIKRQLNRIKKETQLAMHKVHLLSWISYGNYVNKVLNSTKLMEMVVKFIPSNQCYPKEQTNKSYFESIIKWYKTVIGLKSKKQNCTLTRLPPIASSLALQIQTKTAICKKDFVFIFIVLLRSMGIQCRLVINLATVPLRPAAKDLCVISTKNSDEKTVKAEKSNKSLKRKKDSKKEQPSSSKSKIIKSVKSSSKMNDNLKTVVSSQSKNMPQTSSSILNKNAGVSENMKSLKSKLKESVKKAIVPQEKVVKRRNLSLNNSSVVVEQPKRTKIGSAIDDKVDESHFVSTASNVASNLSSPISRRTRQKMNVADSKSISNVAKRIPQLDGGDDKKITKGKPKLYKIKTLVRSSSPKPIPISSSQSVDSTATQNVNTKKAKPQLFKLKKVESKATSVSKSSKINLDSKIASTSTQNNTSKQKQKPQLSKLKNSRQSMPVSQPKITSTSASSVNLTKLVQSTSLHQSSSIKTNSRLALETNLKTSPLKIAQKVVKFASSTLSSQKPMDQNTTKRKSNENVSSDSDFAPTPKKKINQSATIIKPLPKSVEKLKKRIDRRILSTDDESTELAVKKNDMNYWIEVFCEDENKWMCIDLFKLKVNSIDDVKKTATKPIAYVFAWNSSNTIKDVSSRYCSQWNTTTRKLRVEPIWLLQSLCRYKEPNTPRSRAEDRELNKISIEQPLPKTISEYKNHPLYVLKRHLLKFEGIYPPDANSCGFVRDEPIYKREDVYTLHSREIWVKQARVVKPGESPYKIVKARPKWDRATNKMLEPQPLEIFGRWQTQKYKPPTAENGIVPRNAYGNVELFKPEMLPKKTVHLRFAGLNRVCAKLKIDCAQAVVGFDFHSGGSHPTFDGFVVCEEYAELVTAKWIEEQEEANRKAMDKQKQRIYDNWKKLIKGLLIRERLQRKYNFAGKDKDSKK